MNIGIQRKREFADVTYVIYSPAGSRTQDFWPVVVLGLPHSSQLQFLSKVSPGFFPLSCLPSEQSEVILLPYLVLYHLSHCLEWKLHWDREFVFTVSYFVLSYQYNAAYGVGLNKICWRNKKEGINEWVAWINTRSKLLTMELSNWKNFINWYSNFSFYKWGNLGLSRLQIQILTDPEQSLGLLATCTTRFCFSFDVFQNVTF